MPPTVFASAVSAPERPRFTPSFSFDADLDRDCEASELSELSDSDLERERENLPRLRRFFRYLTGELEADFLDLDRDLDLLLCLLDFLPLGLALFLEMLRFLDPLPTWLCLSPLDLLLLPLELLLLCLPLLLDLLLLFSLLLLLDLDLDFLPPPPPLLSSVNFIRRPLRS